MERDVDVHVGTLSKAFGSLGGFAACSRTMKQYLLTRGRAFVYSTALPTPVVAAQPYPTLTQPNPTQP